MKKFFLIPLLALMCSVMAWGTNFSYSVGSSDGSDYPNLNAALTNSDVYADAKLKKGSNITVTLTSNETTGDAIAIDLSAAASGSNRIYVTFDLGGFELEKDIEVTGCSSASNSNIVLQNGTFRGNIILKANGSNLSLKKGTNGLAGNIGLVSEVSNKWWNGGAKIEGFSSGDEISAGFNVNTYTGGITIPKDITVSGDITLANNASLTISGNLTGNIIVDNDWIGAIYFYNGGSIVSESLSIGAGTLSLSSAYSGNVDVNGGTLSLGSNSNYTGIVTYSGNSKLTISNGIYAPANGSNTPASLQITGGTMNFDPSDYLAAEYYATNNGNGTWTVNTYTFLNVTKGFGLTGTDFMALYNDARTADGDSLRLLNNCTLSGAINLNKAVKVSAQSDYRGKISLAADAEVTFSNAGQTFYGLVDVVSGSTANFNAGTYKKIDANGNITVDGANVTLNSANIASGKTLTLNSGTLNSTYSVNLYGTMNIHGGVLNASSITSQANTAKLYMDGGLANFTAGGIRGKDYAFDVLSLTGGAINNSSQTSSEYAAIYLVYRGTTTTIENLTINSVATAIRIDGGWGSYEDLAEDPESYISKPLSISNCNINVSGDYSQSTSSYFNRSAFAMIFNAGIVTLSDNTVTAVKSVVMTNNNNPYVQVIFASGSYETTGTDSIIVAQTNNSETFSIPGTSTARFSKKPVVYIPSFGPGNGMVVEVAEAGYTMNNNGGWWEITEADPIALIGTSTYVRKMSDILNYFIHEGWSTNINIQLLKDYTLTVNSPLYIDAGYTCNLDLNGHVLTVNGHSADKLIVNGTLNIDGTDSGSKIISKKGNGFKVNEGGELNINGGTYKTTQQQSENITYQNEVKQIQVATSYIVRNLGGAVKLTNATFDAGCYAVDNRAGNVTIKGGRYSSSSSIQVGEYLSFVERYHHYGYAIANAGTMSLINATVTGVHGAVICKDEKGVLDIDGCELITENSENLEDANGALVVATNSMVSVKNTKMKSPRANYAAHVGDLDEGRTFGIVNIYAGCYLTDKMYVEQTTASEGILFPMSVAETSAWYEVAVEGGNGPLPAGYVYAAVENAGDDADEYAAGYRWKVVLENEAQKAADGIKPSEVEEQETHPEYTIPWQKNTTWVSDVVPEDNTIVTIPVDAVVAVSQSETVKEAVAEQIFVSAGATLKVEEGTTLTVGEGGVNIANGGQLVVEPGAIVTVGSAGLVTTEEEALVIEATEEDQGVFLLQPAVTENTQPKATVKLVAKAKQVGANEFIWERFAIPTVDGNATIYGNEGLDTVHYYGVGTSLQEGLYEWDGNNWAGVSSWKNLQPFKGYQLTNNSMHGNVVYTFEGNLVGNADMDYQFAESGFGFFGNSYTGDIDIMKFFESFGPNMQKTIWIYDYYVDAFKAITETSYGSVYYGKRNARHGLITDIRSMQAFLMNTFATGASVQNVDYSSAIWGNPKYGLVPTPTPAPAKRVAANEDKFTVYVAGAKQEDEVTFIRNNAYSAAFDNGADASKWMNNGINLYAVTEDGELASVASDEIVDMTIAFQSGNETEYTLGFDNLRGAQFELRDVLTGATIQMTEGATYAFSQEANTTVPARFQIIGAKKVPTGVENVAEGANVQQKIMVNGVLYILRDNKWYNAQGQIVK